MTLTITVTSPVLNRVQVDTGIRHTITISLMGRTAAVPVFRFIQLLRGDIDSSSILLVTLVYIQSLCMYAITW